MLLFFVFADGGHSGNNIKKVEWKSEKESKHNRLPCYPEICVRPVPLTVICWACKLLVVKKEPNVYVWILLKSLSSTTYTRAYNALRCSADTGQQVRATRWGPWAGHLRATAVRHRMILTWPLWRYVFQGRRTEKILFNSLLTRFIAFKCHAL